MTRDEIIQMAREAGLVSASYVYDGTDEADWKDIERFAALVAEAATEEANARANKSWALMCEKMVAAEREACAKLCDRQHDRARTSTGAARADACAAAIRARGAA